MGDEPTTSPGLQESDRRLLEHVLEGQRALQIGLSQLHIVVSEYHSEAKSSNTLLKKELERTDERHDELARVVTTLEERLTVAERKQHAAAVERKLLTAATSALLATAAAFWALAGDAIKKAVFG